MMLFCTAVLNPWALISTLYSAAGIRLKRKRPELSVVACSTAPVERLVALTLAPDTTAPWGSVTVPEMEPFSTCPMAGMHHTSARLTATITTMSRSFRFILYLRIEKCTVQPAKRLTAAHTVELSKCNCRTQCSLSKSITYTWQRERNPKFNKFKLLGIPNYG